MRSKRGVGKINVIRAAGVTCLLISSLTLPKAFAQTTDAPIDPPGIPIVTGIQTQIDQAKKIWSDNAKAFLPQVEGCFQATYPSNTWIRIACSPVSSYGGTIRPDIADVVGNGKDYLIKAAAGKTFQSITASFPQVAGVVSETNANVLFGGKMSDSRLVGDDGKNAYTLQLNALLNKKANGILCNGTLKCISWQQFIVDPDGRNVGANDGVAHVFMQTWLFNYVSPIAAIPNTVPVVGPIVSPITTPLATLVKTSGNLNGLCPPGFVDAGKFSNLPGENCFQNSHSATLPTSIPITDLGKVTLTASASSYLLDTVCATYDGNQVCDNYPDAIAGSANGWNEAEFNVVGDGEGSQAQFNPGSSLTIKLASNYADGSTDAPSCPNSDVDFIGYTGETNNLTLGQCVATAGSLATFSLIPFSSTPAVQPSIQFTESN
jgi:hypothetical protein